MVKATRARDIAQVSCCIHTLCKNSGPELASEIWRKDAGFDRHTTLKAFKLALLTSETCLPNPDLVPIFNHYP